MVLWPNYILTFLCTFTFWALVGESPRAGAMVLTASLLDWAQAVPTPVLCTIYHPMGAWPHYPLDKAQKRWINQKCQKWKIEFLSCFKLPGALTLWTSSPAWFFTPENIFIFVLWSFECSFKDKIRFDPSEKSWWVVKPLFSLIPEGDGLEPPSINPCGVDRWACAEFADCLQVQVHQASALAYHR